MKKIILKSIFVLSISIISFSCTTDSTREEMNINNETLVSSATKRYTIIGNGINDLPANGIADGYYIVSKKSNRAITKVEEGQQLEQTEMADNGLPSSKADLTINYEGTMINSKGEVQKKYKIQWGSLSPFTLTNRFWDVYNSSSADYTPIISWVGLNQDNQRFVFEITGDSDGSVYIKNIATNKYLQIAGNKDVNTTSGAKLELCAMAYNDNQKFFIKHK